MRGLARYAGQARTRHQVGKAPARTAGRASIRVGMVAMWLMTVWSASQANTRPPMSRRSAQIVGQASSRTRQGMMKQRTARLVERASTQTRQGMLKRMTARLVVRAHTLQPLEQARWTPANRAGRARSRVLEALTACWWPVQQMQTVNSRAAMTSCAQILIRAATMVSGMQSAARRRMTV